MVWIFRVKGAGVEGAVSVVVSTSSLFLDEIGIGANGARTVWIMDLSGNGGDMRTKIVGATVEDSGVTGGLRCSGRASRLAKRRRCCREREGSRGKVESRTLHSVISRQQLYKLSSHRLVYKP